ncbi:Uu.00g132100.m01.CDS01 [Anthostomella pinea]|uniref:Uu.00g132100.m01.CDS01 n=1 Tax=Anthostomella pinea TaxID=933095 RepID=A0AAI8VJR0_9PEZI|nr:Uu.00g132100.m01.CDS01 [Anthostomella pinea]
MAAGTGGRDHGAPMFRGAAVGLEDYPPKPTSLIAEETSQDRIGAEDEIDGPSKSSLKDASDMRRMGKQQLLVRRFRQITIAAFIGTTTSAWEYALFLMSPGLIDGGMVGLLYNVLWSFFGFGAIYLSLAEMASMAPIGGSIYHLVSEFAPEKVQKGSSYITGWTSTIAWQAGFAQGVLLAGTLMQTIIQVMDEIYSFANWQGTVLTFAAILISYLMGVYGERALSYWQVPMFAIGTIAYFAFIVPVWVNAPKASHKAVWTGVSNTGGWPDMTLAVLVGQLSGISMQTGVDTAAHMAEEVRDAAIVVPRAMITIFLVDVALMFPLLVTVCYHLPDVQAALDDPTDYPATWIMRQAIKVDAQRSIPVSANIFSCALSAILALIYIGSPVAFYAVTSLNTVSLLQCYVFAIGCVLWRRLTRPETLPPARFSLGRWGMPVNVAAMLYSVWSFFWCFWPQAQPVNGVRVQLGWSAVRPSTHCVGTILFQGQTPLRRAGD